jgi:hypothetical protein
MRRLFFLSLLFAAAIALPAHSQQRGGRGGGGSAPRLDPTENSRGTPDPDSAPVMSHNDSIMYRNRMTAARRPFSKCLGVGFQTCASGETEARLSADGTAYGVLMTRYDGKSAFLWRITGRVNGAAAGGEGGRQRGGGGRARRRG